MHDVRVALDVHVPLEPHGAGDAHAAEVVAGQVDQHDVLGPLLLRGHQLGGEGVVLGRVGAARARARDRAQLAGAVDAEAHVGLRRGADQLEAPHVEQEHVRRGVHGAQRAIEIEWRLRERLRETLGRHELDDVAGADELLAVLHDLLEARLREIARRHRDLRHVDERRRRDFARLPEDGVEFAQFGDRVVVGRAGGRGRSRPTSRRAGSAWSAGPHRRRWWPGAAPARARPPSRSSGSRRRRRRRAAGPCRAPGGRRRTRPPRPASRPPGGPRRGTSSGPPARPARPTRAGTRARPAPRAGAGRRRPG